MNKINIEDNIFLENDIYYLKIDKDCSINIKVSGNAKLVIIGTSNYSINYEVLKDSNLVVNSLNKDNSVNVKINLLKDASVNYNHSTSTSIDSINNFLINHLGNGSISILNNNGINLSNNKLYFQIDGILNKDLSNINCSQNSKIINYEKGNSKIIPNLIVECNDIVANHSAYIGEIEEEELFYFKSRGITDNKIKDIIYKSVLLGKMEMDREKDLFYNILSEWR